MPVGTTRHTCGEEVPVIYTHQVDAFLNPSYCPQCRVKFFPFSMRFDDDSTDTSIAEFEQHIKGVTKHE